MKPLRGVKNKSAQTSSPACCEHQSDRSLMSVLSLKDTDGTAFQGGKSNWVVFHPRKNKR
jgi:hypothetical protein